MARYIGARYVPIMGGAWDNTNEYEPLTVVQYEGDSYTSKMYVPVGVAITNTTYWVKTSNFNQQLSYLNERMQDAEQDIDDIQGDINDLNTDMNSWLDNRTDTVYTNTQMKHTDRWFHTFNIVATKQLNPGDTGMTEIDVTNYLTDGDIVYDMIAIAGYRVNGGDYITGIELNNGSKLVRVDLHNNGSEAHEVGTTVTILCIKRHLIPTA